MKRLVVCCDGTWNTPDRSSPTNVVTLARATRPRADDGTPQIVFYDAGVGVDNLVDRLTGGAFGVGLSRNLREAYLFLVHNYEPGDQLWFFGFSRGAYTVRSVAGLIRNIGLLHKRHAGRAIEGWRLYRRREGGPDSPEAIDFRARYAHDAVPVRFIGVWDTVGALGIPGLLNFIGRRRFQFHNVALSRSVEYAYQALAIDEKRRFFKPALWEQHPDAAGQVMEQAWFPGVHMDAGGGYRDHALSDGAMMWMVEKARAAGLALDDAYLADLLLPDALGSIHESRKFPYTAIPAHHRPLGQGVPSERALYAASRSNEVLHESARQRYDADARYRPPNLVAYLEGAEPTR